MNCSVWGLRFRLAAKFSEAPYVASMPSSAVCRPRTNRTLTTRRSDRHLPCRGCPRHVARDVAGGTRANAIALAERRRERARAPRRRRWRSGTFWPWRSTPFSSLTRPIIWRGAPAACWRFERGATVGSRAPRRAPRSRRERSFVMATMVSPTMSRAVEIQRPLPDAACRGRRGRPVSRRRRAAHSTVRPHVPPARRSETISPQVAGGQGRTAARCPARRSRRRRTADLRGGFAAVGGGGEQTDFSRAFGFRNGDRQPGRSVTLHAECRGLRGRSTPDPFRGWRR